MRFRKQQAVMLLAAAAVVCIGFMGDSCDGSNVSQQNLDQDHNNSRALRRSHEQPRQEEVEANRLAG